MLKLQLETYNFGFDTVDANCAADREAIALDYTAADGRRLCINRDYFRHHSDLKAEFLRFKGGKPGDFAVVCGLEESFELYLLQTALSKIEAVMVIVTPDTLLNAVGAYRPTLAVVQAQSRAVELIDSLAENRPKLCVTVGMPTPKQWRDLHQGSWRVHEFEVPEFGRRTADDVVVVECLTDKEVRYTRRDLAAMTGTSGWKGFVASQLAGKTFVVNSRR